MSEGVGAAHGRERGERVIGGRARIEFGRNILLYSLILSRQVVIRKTSLSRRRGDRLSAGVFLPCSDAAESESERRELVGDRPSAQPPIPHYNTVFNIVNIILPR